MGRKEEKKCFAHFLSIPKEAHIYNNNNLKDYYHKIYVREKGEGGAMGYLS